MVDGVAPIVEYIFDFGQSRSALSGEYVYSEGKDAKKALQEIQQLLTLRCTVAEKHIEKALLCWLNSCTYNYGKAVLKFKQKKSDFYVDEIDENFSDEPTDACGIVCSLWRRRRDQARAMLSGDNLTNVVKGLDQALLDLIWTHVQSQTVTVLGAHRLSLDVREYMALSASLSSSSQIYMASTASGTKSQKQSKTSLSRSFQLLMKVSLMLTWPPEHVISNHRDIPRLSALEREDFQKFIHCRADVHDKGAPLLSWLERLFGLRRNAE